MRIAREFAKNAEDSGGRSMIIIGAGICHWFHADVTYRAIMALLMLTGCIGKNGGGWAQLRGAGEVPADDGLVQPGQRAGLVAAAAHHDRHRLLVHAHRPVAHRRLLGRPGEVAAVHRSLDGLHTADAMALSHRLG